MARFFIDHDVSASVRSMLVRRGHEAWTASQAGMAADRDEDIAIYADDQHAILVTHDREFAQSSARRRFGRMIWLRCDEPDAADVLERYLDDMLPSSIGRGVTRSGSG